MSKYSLKDALLANPLQNTKFPDDFVKYYLTTIRGKIIKGQEKGNAEGMFDLMTAYDTLKEEAVTRSIWRGYCVSKKLPVCHNSTGIQWEADQ